MKLGVRLKFYSMVPWFPVRQFIKRFFGEDCLELMVMRWDNLFKGLLKPVWFDLGMLLSQLGRDGLSCIHRLRRRGLPHGKQPIPLFKVNHWTTGNDSNCLVLLNFLLDNRQRKDPASC